MYKLIVLSFCVLCLGCNSLRFDKPSISPYDRRAEDSIYDDYDIEGDIKEVLNSNKEMLRGSRIDINAYNQAVLLTGQVPSELVKNKVLNAVRIIKPIKRVFDYLAVAPITNYNQRNNDTLITQAIYSALNQVHGLAYFNPAVVKVITTNNVVYLMGLVHRDEGDTVIKLARLQPNVQSIVTIFDYLD